MSLVRRLSNSRLVRGSLLVFIASNIANFGNFLYNLSMGRLLGPKHYGDLGAIFSILVIIGVPLSVLNLMFVKITSSYHGKRNLNEIKALIFYFTPRLFILGISVFILLILASPVLTGFLNLDSLLPIVILSFFFIFSVPSTVNRAILQGTLSFLYLAVNSFIEVLIKIIVSITLVIYSFQLNGALLGPLISLIVGYLLTVVELRFILRDAALKKFDFTAGKILKPAVPILFSTFTLSLTVNADIVLVRHFFDAGTAGQYVALSTAGKIILYMAGPVIFVMFPLVNSRVESGKSYILPLFGTLVLSLSIGVFLMFLYFLFPKLIISLLFGSNYFEIVPLLGMFGFFITIYTINSILTYFLLSLSWYRSIYCLFLVALLQVPLLFLFHNSILQVIGVNICVCLLYLFASLYFIWQKESKVISRVLPKILKRNIYAA